MNISKKLPFLSSLFLFFCTSAMEKGALPQELQQNINSLAQSIADNKDGEHFAQHFLIYKNGPHGDVYLGYGSLDNYIDFAYKGSDRTDPWVCDTFRFFIPKNSINTKILNQKLVKHIKAVIKIVEKEKATSKQLYS